jgi:hypothetical protein
MTFVFDDGGRVAAGYKGTTGDCVTRAIAIATGMPYQKVYDALNEKAEDERGRWTKPRTSGQVRRRRKSSARKGVFKPTYKKYIASLGWLWTPTMGIGTGCKVHLRAEELPPGRLIVSCSRHLVAVIDGVIHDIYDPSRGGTRCVYGYFKGPV